MVGQRRRRWPIIKQTSGEHIVFAGYSVEVGPVSHIKRFICHPLRGHFYKPLNVLRQIRHNRHYSVEMTQRVALC